MLLGRHIYRVEPLESGGWSVRKDGEDAARGNRSTREEAARYAAQLAVMDQPSKVVVEDWGGAIVAERWFGDDAASELESAVDGHRPPPKSESR